MKIHKIAQSKIGDNKYVNHVSPKIYAPSIENKNFDIEADEVLVPFTIDLDIRDWGVKGITMFVDSTIVVNLHINEWGDEKDIETEKNIPVDLSRLPREEVSHGHGAYTVTGITLQLDNQFEVNYKESSIEFAIG